MERGTYERDTRQGSTDLTTGKPGPLTPPRKTHEPYQQEQTIRLAAQASWGKTREQARFRPTVTENTCRTLKKEKDKGKSLREAYRARK